MRPPGVCVFCLHLSRRPWIFISAVYIGRPTAFACLRSRRAFRVRGWVGGAVRAYRLVGVPYGGSRA